MGDIKELFGKNRKALAQTSISDITGSETPVESSDYIERYLEEKGRFLPPVNYATASNFAHFGSAEQYAEDAISRVYKTYPYDGSLTEKIEWFNLSNFYDLYIFNHRYPRTCGYAVFSPNNETGNGWGTAGTAVNSMGLSNALEYIQFKGGPHSDPNSGSLKLSHQFPEPWDGKANVWDNTTGINRESNLALNLNNGVSVEFWIKKPANVTAYETIFDLWNGYTGTAEGNSYGRFHLYAIGASSTLTLELHSGSLNESLTFDSTVNSAVYDGKWHHLAITAKQVVDSDNKYNIEWTEFLDGKFIKTSEDETSNSGTDSFGPITGSMIANIGAARIPALTQAEAAASNVQTIITAGTNDGYGKLSGSIDEFRYWKTARTAQEISRFWFTQIGGGTNTDAAKFSGSAQPVDLGIYYKFNEGNTGTNSTDSVVLDYSGRISNGTWVGFVSGSSRVAGPTSSAMIESSASLTEFKDPIIYSSHPDVAALSTEMSSSGLEWDLSNNAALYHTMPEWITSEDQKDESKTLKKLTQIVASYLDTTFLQIKAVPTIGDNQYPFEELTVHNPRERNEAKTKVRTYSNSPVPFAKNQVEGLGMQAPEIFAAANELAQLANRDEYQEFDQKLYDTKNTIYQNIYNNLVYIYKSKGTEKAFRNLIRCYGIDDELIKINLYADNTTYRLDDANYRSTSIKSKYIDFNEVDRTQSTIYQSASLAADGTTTDMPGRSHIPGDSPTNLAAAAVGSAMTFETDIVFPVKFDRTHPSNAWYSYPHLTSSLFGCHEDSATLAAGDFYWTGADSAADDKASFQIYALRPEEDSKDVRFMLTSSYGGIPTLTSSEFTDVYDNERWLFAVKVYPESRQLEGGHVSGSLATQIGGNHIIEFHGYNPSLDQFQNSFVLSGTLTAANGAAFMNANKRIYAGAHRQNFSGSLLKYSDVKVGTVRVWADYLTDSEIKTHAVDPTNFGRDRAYKSAHLFNQSDDPNVDTEFIPQFETLLLNWDFANITGSSADVVGVNHYGGSDWKGSFEIIDASSGSDDKWSVPDKYKHHYTGRGDYFLPSVTKVVDLNFLNAAKTNLPEVMSGPDTVSILDKDDDFFTRDSKPINHYFAIEKSMYQVISEEMLNMFATVTEFNNIIGEPANRYRPEYKALGKLREAFFRKVTNTPDFNKFVDYYRWIDDSLTTMLMQLIPATANFSDGVKTMIESHILERNKYWTKFPSMEFKGEPTIGFVKGISELTYDWKHGHAPLNPTQYSNEDTNCLWWKERGEARGFAGGAGHEGASTSGDAAIDADRNTLRRILTSDVSTNKILATGEYTDPTDYPNSGFPNAAQFNLSQKGNSLDARAQYKGSTYALRRFSKPYKMYLEKSLNLHGGENPPSNNKGIDYLWSTHRAFSNAASTNSTKFILEGAVDGDADYNLKESKCADNITPIEIRKIRRSSETQPYATADATDALKSMLVSPFQYFSQSSDIATSRAMLDVDNNTAYHGLHDDSYGELNETPIQGPFTQAHVGGRQYRHFEASSSFLGTDHNDSNRAEGYRVAAVGETVYGPRTTDLGASAPQNAAGMYYRDEVAKRPLNIRNIQSTTASNALGNYERLSQVVIANTDESMFYAKLQAAHDDAGLHSLLSGTSSPIISDTHDFAKLRAVGKTVLDSNTVLTAPYDSTQVDPYLTKHSIIERFSAPGGPDTAGDAFGGFGIDRETNRYAVYNALPWRNLAVRTPLNAMQTAHCARYGSLAGSALGATDVTTAGTASFHKVHRNSDYDIRNTSALTAYRANSVYFGGTTSANFNRLDTNIDELTEMSVSIWFRTPDISGTEALFSWGQRTTTAAAHYLGVDDGEVFLQWTSAASLQFKTTGTPISANTWHHVVIAWGQGSGQGWRQATVDYLTLSTEDEFYPKLWIDGERVNFTIDTTLATTWTGPYAGTEFGDITIGGQASAATANNYNGYIQDVSVWNAILDDEQAKDLYRLPGYDSFGPGDLTRLKYVTSDEDVNKLHAWWQFNHATSISDVAPIGNALTLTNNSTPSLNTTTFLPANYYATDCIETKDNWFIQHPIPANDFGYAWITASADKDTGCDTLTTASFVTASDFGSFFRPEYSTVYSAFGIRAGGTGAYPSPSQFLPVDFAGLNTHIYEPVDSDTNTVGYPAGTDVGFDAFSDISYINHKGNSGVAGFVTNTYYVYEGASNSLMLHRNGPYGHPSWKQIRTGEHPVARNHKKQNIISLSDTPTTRAFVQSRGGTLSTYTATELKASTHTNYIEPPLSIKHSPLIHRITSLASGIPQSLAVRHSYANNLSTFSNTGLANSIASEQAPRQLYDDFKDMYLAGDDSAVSNPVKAFNSLVYTETVYPKEVNTFLGKTRARTSYAETAAVISSSANGDYRTFWRDTLTDRRRDDGAANSMGYRIFENPNLAFDYAAGFSDNTFDQGLYYLGTGSLSVWPLDTGGDRQHQWDAIKNETGGDMGLPGLNIAHAGYDAGPELPLGDEYGGTWGELHANPNASIWASMNTADLNAVNASPANFARDAVLHATASIHFKTTNNASYVGKTITIYDFDNTAKTFIFNGLTGDAETGVVVDGKVSVHLYNLGTGDLYAEEFWDAVVGSTGHATNIWTTRYDYGQSTTAAVYLTQTGSGPTGHRVITTDDGSGSPISDGIIEVFNFAGGNHFMSDDKFKCPGTASVCLNHWEYQGLGNVVQTRNGQAPYDAYPGLSYGTQAVYFNDTIPLPYTGKQMANWSTNHWAGRSPWYDTYEKYSDDIRSMAKEYTVVPEFKISDHMDYYINNNFGAKNFNFLSLEGAAQTSSADTETSGYNETFWKEYCHSDFMKNFATIQKDHEDIAQSNIISFRCSAIKKLLPYNGFYPVQRTLQLASLFSSSYGPYISGSSAASYGEDTGPTINESGRDKYFAERLQSLMQPFYAPGIMYNTIKSGIAVDYPIHTASAELRLVGSQRSHQRVSHTVAESTSTTGPWDGNMHGVPLSHPGCMLSIVSEPELRMPFEALINPSKYLPIRDDVTQTTDTADKMYLTATSYGTSSFYATWNGNAKPNYSMAANNFAAEVPNFFLKNKTFTTFRSAPEKKFMPMFSGSTYYMDVILRKSADMMMNNHAGWAYDEIGKAEPAGLKTGWGYGPRYWSLSDDAESDNPRVTNGGYVANTGDPSYAPHCPPYHYGTSVARLAFTPHEHSDMAPDTSLKFSLDDILSNSRLNPETSYTNQLGTGLMQFMSESVQVLKDKPSSPAAAAHMRLSSSVNLFGKTFIPAVQYDPITHRPVSVDESAAEPAWVIHSKFECPTLNFATTKGGGLAPNEETVNGGTGVTELSSSWWTNSETEAFSMFPTALQRPIGMWNGYGEVPTGDTGIFLGLRESFPAEVFGSGEPELRNTGSLLQTCGFRAEQRRIGELANHKWISEAVVAIPFVDVEGRRKFFALGDTQGQSRAVWDNAIAGADGPGRSIMRLARQMGRYVIPPHLDFSVSKDIEPFAMYIFEFWHKFSQQDLSNIWQNVMPDIGVTAEKSTTALTHRTGENEFFRGMPIPKNTRWMVFKVKKRARKDYFKVTADTTDDHQFQFEFDQGGHKAIPDYSYNWPYDFFSLVELAKIDVKVGVGNDDFPTLPTRTIPEDIVGEQAFKLLAASQMFASNPSPQVQQGGITTAVDVAETGGGLQMIDKIIEGGRLDLVTGAPDIVGMDGGTAPDANIRTRSSGMNFNMMNYVQGSSGVSSGVLGATRPTLPGGPGRGGGGPDPDEYPG